jgi:hypothetical protein
MPKVPIHSKLAYLSEDQINALITRYYTGERIADLLAEYAVAFGASAVVINGQQSVSWILGAGRHIRPQVPITTVRRQAASRQN